MNILLRTVVLVVAAIAAFYVADLLGPAGVGANIGAGILAFGVVAVGSFAWAVFDGRTPHTLSALALRWVVIGLLVALFFSFYPQVGGEAGINWSIWRADLVNNLVLGMVVSTLPAGIGLAIGRAVA